MIRRVPPSAEDVGIDRPVAVLGDPEAVAAVIRQLGDDTTTHVWSTFPADVSEYLPATAPVVFASTPSEAAQGAGVVLLVAPDDDLAEAILFDPDGGKWGVVHGADDQSVVVDLSCREVWVTRAVASLAAQSSMAFVDAPLSVIDGPNAVISAGGADLAVTRARPVLDRLAKHVVHAGAIGAGQVAFAAERLIAARTIEAVAEAMALARHGGVEPERLSDALGAGMASGLAARQGARMVAGDFRPGVCCADRDKEVGAIRELARTLGLHLPGLEVNAEIWHRAVGSGLGALDESALLLALDPEMAAGE